MRIVFIVALVLSFTMALQAQEQVTVQALLNNGKQYDGKQVVLVGVASKLKQKVSKKGNAYYTFRISDGKQSVSVFGYGNAPAKEGDKVRVTDKFAVEKRVGYATYRNEIDVTKGKVEVLSSTSSDKPKAPTASEKK